MLDFFLTFAWRNTEVMTKIIGLGNALVDILIKLPGDELLKEAGLLKGSMLHVARETIDDLLLKTISFPRQITSGGSAGNAIHGLARLGHTTAFIGKTGPDCLGDSFRKDLEDSGIIPLLITSTTDTGTAVAFITPDSERTFAVFLGAASELNAGDLNKEMFKGYEILHIEGYLVQNHELIETALRIAKAQGLKVSFDMASYNVVESNLQFLRHIVELYVDIVFANEEEAMAITGLDPLKAVSSLSSHCEIAIVKIGSKGSLIQSGEQLFSIGAIPVRVVDTTGAGDLYAAGFLHGLTSGLTLDKCGQAGSILAGNVIRFIGAKIPETEWPLISKEISKFA